MVENIRHFVSQTARTGSSYKLHRVAREHYSLRVHEAHTGRVMEPFQKEA